MMTYSAYPGRQRDILGAVRGNGVTSRTFVDLSVLGPSFNMLSILGRKRCRRATQTLVTLIFNPFLFGVKSKYLQFA